MIDCLQCWWLVGYGVLNLYVMLVEIVVGSCVVVQVKCEIGLCLIELCCIFDCWGYSFVFVVNGFFVFVKGVNLVLFDVLFLCIMDECMCCLLDDVCEVYVNMLCVWGGGMYLFDVFYVMVDCCGLMIWQDFMFGGVILFLDVVFCVNVKQEVIEQVMWLCDYFLIVLWLGNNEVQISWESWGDWQDFCKCIGVVESVCIECGMYVLFDDILCEVVMQFDFDVLYWFGLLESEGGVLVNSLDSGDVYVWDVWGGLVLVEDYFKSMLCFQLEFGLQLLLVMVMIYMFVMLQDLVIDLLVMCVYQKFDYGNGNQCLLLYVCCGYGELKDFVLFVYFSQVMQVDGIELVVDYLCSVWLCSMGVLYWQFNDVWLGVLWLSIDVDGCWKVLQFCVWQFYVLVCVVLLCQYGCIVLFVVFDCIMLLIVELCMWVFGMDGMVVVDIVYVVMLLLLVSICVDDFVDVVLLYGVDLYCMLVVFELIVDGQMFLWYLLYFDCVVVFVLLLL